MDDWEMKLHEEVTAFIQEYEKDKRAVIIREAAKLLKRPRTRQETASQLGALWILYNIYKEDKR